VARKATSSPEDFANKEPGCKFGRKYMAGATLRQETELSMIGGGLEIDGVLDGVWAVVVIVVFVVSEACVERSDVSSYHLIINSIITYYYHSIILS